MNPLQKITTWKKRGGSPVGLLYYRLCLNQITGILLHPKKTMIKRLISRDHSLCLPWQCQGNLKLDNLDTSLSWSDHHFNWGHRGHLPIRIAEAALQTAINYWNLVGQNNWFSILEQTLVSSKIYNYVRDFHLLNLSTLSQHTRPWFSVEAAATMMCHKIFNAIIPKICATELLEGGLRGCHGRTEGKQLDQYETNGKPRRWDWVSKTKREEHGSHKNGQDMIGWLGWKFKINPKRSSTALNERATKVITVHSYHIWSFRWCGLQVTSVPHIKQTEVSSIITFQQQNNALIKRRHQSWRYGALTCIWLNVCFRSKSYFLHPTKKNETQDLKHDAFYI